MVTSTSISAGAPIAAKFTEDGDDVSPQISWTAAPSGTKELALIVDDPDAPTAEPWVHWVMYKIAATVSKLPEGVTKAERPVEPVGVFQGRNSWKTLGYRGPAPPKGHGVHHYRFRVYALNAPIDAGPGLDKRALLQKMKGHIVAEGELVGTYQR